MGELAVVPSKPVGIMEIVREVASNPQADVGKLEKLLDLQERYEKNQARVAFNRAMLAAQNEMEPIRRDAANSTSNSRYARLETIDAAARPIYTRHGFALSYTESDPKRGTDNIRIRCNVHHLEGHTEPYELEAPPDTMGPKGTPTKTGVQGMGSTVSYLRRYLECMIFNIQLTNEDNDGQRHKPAAPPPPPQQQPAPPTEKPKGGKTFDHLKAFGDLKARFLALGREDEYRAGLGKWGKQKSNQFGADEMRSAADCWKYLNVRVQRLEKGTPVDVRPDPVPLPLGTRVWFEGKTWEVWDSPEGFDWHEVVV